MFSNISARARRRAWGGAWSEGQHFVCFRAELRRFWRGRPAPIDLRQMLVGRPTGDPATLSDVNGNRVVPELGHQLPHRRHADALHLIEVIPEQYLGSVANKYECAVVAHL